MNVAPQAVWSDAVDVPDDALPTIPVRRVASRQDCVARMHPLGIRLSVEWEISVSYTVINGVCMFIRAIFNTPCWLRWKLRCG